MIELKGYKVEKLPFEGLERISDLIEFEGPILSHYRDKFKHNYLFYWVDNDAVYNRWLVWEIKEEFLYLYLTGDVSLEQIFPKPDERIYSVDIDTNIKYSNIEMLYVDSVDQSYLPEPDSFFKFEIPEAYKEKIQPISYRDVLKEKALYLNIKSTTDRYGGTIGIKDIWEVFQNIGKSFHEYVLYGVKEMLTQRIPDPRLISVEAMRMSELSRLRVVYLNLNSFHVGIAADNLSLDSKIEDPAIVEYKSQVLTSFQNEVLDNDFNSKDEVDSIINKFSDDEIRKKIFDPIIKIINNDNIKININNYTESFSKEYKHIPKSEAKRISPDRLRLKDSKGDIHQTLVQAYIIVDQESESQLTLFPDNVKGRVIAFREAPEFQIEIDKVTGPSGDIVLKTPIELRGTFEDGIFKLVYEKLGIVIIENQQNRLISSFNQEFIRIYESYKDGNQQFSKELKELVD